MTKLRIPITNPATDISLLLAALTASLEAVKKNKYALQYVTGYYDSIAELVDDEDYHNLKPTQKRTTIIVDGDVYIKAN